MNKRSISILLLLSFGTMFAASCGEPGGSDVTTELQANVTTIDETSSDELIDDLPKDLNFGGETINVLYRDDVVNSFYVSEQTGDIVDDAVYNSNHAVEERLDVKLNMILMA